MVGGKKLPSTISSRQEDEFVVAPVAEILHTIRKQDGTYYPPNTLYQICVGVQRYLRENGFEDLNIFQDSQYKAFQDSLDARMKNLTRSGLGITVKQAKPILEDEEEILWSKGLLGDSNPKTLVNTLAFLFEKYFALRNGEEHRSLSQFCTTGSGKGRRNGTLTVEIFLLWRKELRWRTAASTNQT